MALSCSKKAASITTRNNLKNNAEKVCINKDFCGITLPNPKDNILKLNQYMKSDKTPCIIYADLESLIKKTYNCEYNPEIS